MDDLLNDGRPFVNASPGSLGLSRKQLRIAYSSRRVRAVFRGVGVDARVSDSRELRIEAIKLVAPPYAIVCDCSASWLHGVDAYRPADRFDLVPSLVIPHGMTRVGQVGARCRQAILPTDDVMEIDGVLVTTPVRTASDLLRRLRAPYALGAADGLAHEGLVDPNDLWEYVARLKGYRGIVQARRLADLVEPDTESRGESWTRLRLVDADFPRPTAQFVVADRRGREVYRLDLAYVEQMVGIEYDGIEFHTDDVDVEHDEQRRLELRERWGWRIVVTDRKGVLADDVSLEREVGHLLGRQPLLPRQW